MSTVLETHTTSADRANPVSTDPGQRLRDALAALPALADEIGQDAAGRELRRELPFEAFSAFRRSGLGALRIPAEQGGLGGTLEDAIHVVTTLAAAESNTAHALRVHFDVVESLRLAPRSRFNDRQVQRIVGGALFGGASGELGTARAGQINTVLRRHGENFRVSGKKYYTTGTAYADYARTNLVDEQGNGVTAIIDVRSPGVEVLDDWDGMGQRMTASGSVVFTDVDVPAEEVVAKGYATLGGRHGGAYRQLHLVAVAAGIVRNIVADAKRYVLDHGRPVLHSTAPTAREDAFIQQVVGELSALSHTIDVLVRDNARVLDRSSSAIRAGDGPNRATPILALSADVLAGQQAACRAAGMNDHIAKPIDVADLLSKVAYWTRTVREADLEIEPVSAAG